MPRSCDRVALFADLLNIEMTMSCNRSKTDALKAAPDKSNLTSYFEWHDSVPANMKGEIYGRIKLRFFIGWLR